MLDRGGACATVRLRGVQAGRGAVRLRRPATLRLLDAGLVGGSMQLRDKVPLVGELAHNVYQRLHVALVSQERPAGTRYRLADVAR